jgi:hypothetical protein
LSTDGGSTFFISLSDKEEKQMRNDINRRPRPIGTTLTAAFAVIVIMALLMIGGPWSPRLVERDMAGMEIGTSTRPLPPGTPVPSAPTTIR